MTTDRSFRLVAVFLSSLAAVIFFAPLAFARKHDVADALTIANLELQWVNAQKIGKPETVASTLADSFIGTDIDGRTHTKDQALSTFKGVAWEENAISDVKITVYGNAAVATGTWTGKGVESAGAKIDRRQRWTETWIRKPNKKWQCVARQETVLK